MDDRRRADLHAEPHSLLQRLRRFPLDLAWHVVKIVDEDDEITPTYLLDNLLKARVRRVDLLSKRLALISPEVCTPPFARPKKEKPAATPPPALMPLPLAEALAVLVGVPIQSSTRFQTSSGARMPAPVTVMSNSLPTTFSTSTVLPDFDGPTSEQTWPGVSSASRSCCSSRSPARATYVWRGKRPRCEYPASFHSRLPRAIVASHPTAAPARMAA